MESAKPTTVTGSRGEYLWLATNRHDLATLVLHCPKAFLGKYVIVTSLDSGPLRLTEEQKTAGWRSQNEIAYSPQVQSPDELPYGGFDEWYVFDSPKQLGEVWHGNVFDGHQTPQQISVFCNFGDFSPHDPELEALVSLFWRQIDQIRPQSYVADGNAFLTFVSRDKELFADVHQALSDAP